MVRKGGHTGIPPIQAGKEADGKTRRAAGRRDRKTLRPGEEESLRQEAGRAEVFTNAVSGAFERLIGLFSGVLRRFGGLERDV